MRPWGSARHSTLGAASPRRSTEVYKGVAGTPAAAVAKGVDLRKETERVLLARYSGAGVVVDETLEVLETFGQTAAFLTLPSGRISLSLLKLIPKTRLFLEVEKLVREVQRSGEAGRKDRIPYQSEVAPEK
jgi:two-component system, chemotaxis family, CheB/CheR fusion protein